MNMRGWLVGLYPHSWRQRYGDEFDALLEQCLHSPLDVIDIVLGAVDAHLHFTPISNWRTTNMDNKLRTAILIVFSAYIAFVVAGVSLYGLADDSPMAALMKTGTDVPLLASWLTVQAGALIGLVAVVTGALPLSWIVLRNAFTGERRNSRLLLVPVLSFLALVLYVAFMVFVGTGLLTIPGVQRTVTPENFPVGNKLLIAGAMLVFILGAIASTLAVWRLLTRTDVPESTIRVLGRETSIRPYQHALVPAVIASASMLLMLGGTVAWGWLSYSAMPQVFSANWGLLQTNTTLSYMATLVVMLLATGVAFTALVRVRAGRLQSGA